MSALSSASFQRLVSALKQSKKTLTVVEQSTGGLINASIMAQPGASRVFFGGSIAYNTRKAKPLLLNDDDLHSSLTNPLAKDAYDTKSNYVDSKLDWTAKTSVAFCNALETDYCIAEGGATGPTFRPKDLSTGFSVISVAGRDADGTVRVLEQSVVESTHADREANMRLFADSAANLATAIVAADLKDDILNVPVEQLEQEYETAAALMLDRATHIRSDPEALAELAPVAKYVILCKNEILVGSITEPALLQHNQAKDLEGQTTFLGILHDENKTPIFSLDLVDEEKEKALALGNGYEFADTRTGAPLFAPLENELALHATAYAQWQRRSSFCTLCGSPTTLVDGGTCRRCTSCKALSWPRQDPSMIAAISSRDGRRILLARSKRHPPKMHTVLAGFVEAGETFEAAVAREVFEETGIRIDEGSVKYIGSQPWPFPQSCMIAFTATADCSQPLDIDEDELVSAEWFDKSQVLAATTVEGSVMQHEAAAAALKNDPDLSLLIPPKRVIARTLIDTWLGEGK